MDKILVTGGAGFIGSCLVKELVRKQNVHVINLDRLTYAGNLDSLAETSDNRLHTFVQGDIGNATLVEELLSKHQPRSIINLAAESHVDRSIEAPKVFMQTNVVGTAVLLEAARKFWDQLPVGKKERFRFLQVSTDEVFGSLGEDGAFDEATPYAPNSPYAASKAAADHWVRAYHQTYSLPTLITNCSNNYGPYQFPEKLFPVTILNALQKKQLPIYGSGKNVRDWLHVDDHVSALQQVLARGNPGHSYCIGGNNERTNVQVVSKICDACDLLLQNPKDQSCRSLIQHVPDRPGHDYRYAIDASKIRRELGWQPQCDLQQGITQTVRWYSENRAWAEEMTREGYTKGESFPQ